MTKSDKSDKSAKLAFCQHLEEIGFSNVKITQGPVDVEAEKEKKKWVFELKKTATKKSKYFGATTLTELGEAINKEVEFRFIIAKELSHKRKKYQYEFLWLTLEQFIKLSSPTIPPFKVYFNLPLTIDPSEIDKKDDAPVNFNEKTYHSFLKKNKKNISSVKFEIADIKTLNEYMNSLRTKN